MITAKGTAVLADFGLAAIPGLMQVSSSINLAGPIRWMAPERIESMEEDVPLPVTRESDIFSLGMTILQVHPLAPSGPVIHLNHVPSRF